MGALTHFNIHGLIHRYGIKSFVETGTGDGTSLAQAMLGTFEELHSIELVPELAQAARVRFAKDKRIHIWEGDSRTLLPQVLDQLPDGPCLFWLDAHFAGADYGMGEYDGDKDIGRRLPLQHEVELIARVRRDALDVVMIDDARLYVPGPYGAGDLPNDFPGIKGLRRDIGFVRRALGKSHGIVIDYADQGYLMACPRVSYDTVNA